MLLWQNAVPPLKVAGTCMAIREGIILGTSHGTPAPTVPCCLLHAESSPLMLAGCALCWSLLCGCFRVNQAQNWSWTKRLGSAEVPVGHTAPLPDLSLALPRQLGLAWARKQPSSRMWADKSTLWVHGTQTLLQLPLHCKHAKSNFH